MQERALTWAVILGFAGIVVFYLHDRGVIAVPNWLSVALMSLGLLLCVVALIANRRELKQP